LQDFYALGYITSPGHCRLPIADFRLAFEIKGVPPANQIGNRKLKIDNDLVAVGGVEPPTSRL
jgi:hypothetical protein